MPANTKHGVCFVWTKHVLSFVQKKIVGEHLSHNSSTHRYNSVGTFSFAHILKTCADKIWQTHFSCISGDSPPKRRPKLICHQKNYWNTYFFETLFICWVTQEGWEFHKHTWLTLMPACTVMVWPFGSTSNTLSSLDNETMASVLNEIPLGRSDLKSLVNLKFLPKYPSGVKWTFKKKAWWKKWVENGPNNWKIIRGLWKNPSKLRRGLIMQETGDSLSK